MPDASLRVRKKRETHRALAEAAQELVRERGLEHVTVEDIAAAANVSVRTFFNYFATKEESIVGVDDEVLAELADEILQRPEDERPIDVLRFVLVDEAGSGMLRRWQLRNELVARYPVLLPRHLAATVQVEEALAAADVLRKHLLRGGGLREEADA
jgi:AcrR family transcriptional regulator